MNAAFKNNRMSAQRFVLAELKEVENELIFELAKGDRANQDKVDELQRSLNCLWSLCDLEVVWPESSADCKQ